MLHLAKKRCPRHLHTWMAAPGSDSSVSIPSPRHLLQQHWGAGITGRSSPSPAFLLADAWDSSPSFSRRRTDQVGWDTPTRRARTRPRAAPQPVEEGAAAAAQVAAYGAALRSARHAAAVLFRVGGGRGRVAPRVRKQRGCRGGAHGPVELAACCQPAGVALCAPVVWFSRAGAPVGSSRAGIRRGSSGHGGSRRCAECAACRARGSSTAAARAALQHTPAAA